MTVMSRVTQSVECVAQNEEASLDLKTKNLELRTKITMSLWGNL